MNRDLESTSAVLLVYLQLISTPARIRKKPVWRRKRIIRICLPCQLVKGLCLTHQSHHVSQLYDMYKVGWSWKFFPTPGRSTRVPIPRPDSSFLGPMPESCSSLGVCAVPAAKMISRHALTFVTVLVLVALRGTNCVGHPLRSA